MFSLIIQTLTPKGSTFQSGIMAGFDYGNYPYPRTWTIGISVNF